MITIRRVFAALCLTAALAGCSISVSHEDVASTITSGLTDAGFNVTAASCPDDLPAEVGKSVRCDVLVEGLTVVITATVTSVQGTKAQFDVVPQYVLILKEKVAAAVDGRLAELGVDPDEATECPSLLIGERGRSLRCESVVAGQPVDAIATVDSVEGTTVTYDFEFKARPVAADLLATDLAGRVEQDLQVPIDAAECEGDLQPSVGETVTCTVTSGPDSLDVVVRFTGVGETGLPRYSWEAA